DKIRLLSPTLPSHIDDLQIPGTTIIYPSGAELRELDEILGVGKGSLRRHQATLSGEELGGNLGELADLKG
ncbi:unnamed protein product, partial [Ilex paraguariensis]